ncbi:hypothetical protein HW555_002451 [Spodoptera exigua]|uniref:Uncharacterized protein n=1 Tax=Spodoptera exigua TaxID=7107 RepID=A0A835GNX5_SPOEX|nr:hypothetical protein HW555_002451 [Spodoptera exigua]
MGLHPKEYSMAAISVCLKLATTDSPSVHCLLISTIMFRLPYGERVDPMEEKRQARENTISSVITFAILCAAIRVAPIILEHSGL